MKGRANYKHSNSGQIFSCEPLFLSPGRMADMICPSVMALIGRLNTVNEWLTVSFNNSIFD